MQLNFIQADLPLTKNLKTGDTYPMVTNVSSYSHVGTGLNWLYAVITMHASKGHALLTGKLKKELRNESRAGQSDAEDLNLIILDVDKELPFDDREEFLSAIGIDCGYVFQHSSGSTNDRSIRGHYFILLKSPRTFLQVKNWLKHINLHVLNKNLELTASGLGIKWPLDIVVNDPGRIVYIAPPITDNDPITERIILVEKGTEFFSMPDVDEVDIY